MSTTVDLDKTFGTAPEGQFALNTLVFIPRLEIPILSTPIYFTYLFSLNLNK